MAPPPEQLKAQADADRENGLKALRAGNYERAVELLGKCLENMVVLYGELAPECAYTYFKYGTALFYKAQEDADVMGGDNAVKAAAEAKKEKLAGEKGSGSEPGSSSKTGEDKEAQSSSAGKADRDAPAALPDRKGKGPAKEEDAAAEDEEEEDEGGDGEQEEEIGEEDEAEDEGDQALAWQVLESARVIYERMPARSLDEADVIMTLADISLEKEEFANCMADYHRAIGLLHALLPPHHRRIAEAYFRLCLAHQTAQQPIEALASCRKAIESCNLCVQHLKAQIGDTAPGPDGARDPAPASSGPQGPEPSEAAAATEPAEGEASKASSAAASLSASGEASSSAASEPGAVAARKEEAMKELEEVEAVVGDLKEKEAEILEMLSNPSLQHLLASAAAKASGEAAKGSEADAIEARGTKASVATITGQAAAGSSKAEIVSGNAQMTDQGVAVVGRGKKRVAPTPIDAALPSDAKRLC